MVSFNLASLGNKGDTLPPIFLTICLVPWGGIKGVIYWTPSSLRHFVTLAGIPEK